MLLSVMVYHSSCGYRVMYQTSLAYNLGYLLVADAVGWSFGLRGREKRALLVPTGRHARETFDFCRARHFSVRQSNALEFNQNLV